MPTLEEGKLGGMAYPISTIEITQKYIVNSTNSDPIHPPSEDLDGDVDLVWTVNSTLAMDYLNIALTSDEAI